LVVANNEETARPVSTNQFCRKKKSAVKKQRGKFGFALDMGPANGLRKRWNNASTI
jgi:hypothetical protein